MDVLGTAVLIKPDKMPERTKSGRLVVPANSKEMESEWGVVLDCGPACKVVKKYDHLMFPRKSSSIITIDGTDLYFVSEAKILFMRENQKP